MNKKDMKLFCMVFAVSFFIVSAVAWAADSTLLKTRYGITATVEELNAMDGVTATTAELNYMDGVTSNVQTQMDTKLTGSINAVSMVVAAGSTFNTVTVDSTHKLMGYYVSTVGSYNATTIANVPVYDGSGVWKISLAAAVGPNPVTFTFNFLDVN